MKLDRERLATDAFTIDVDLQRLFIELIEAVVMRTNDVASMSHVRQLTSKGEHLLEQVKALGYEGLSEGKWRTLFSEEIFTENTIIDAIESLIRIQGRYCRINNVQDLKSAAEAFHILAPNITVNVFYECLAETAVNQSLEESGIGRIEHTKILSEVDIHLIEENNEIVRLVRQKMVKLFM